MSGKINILFEDGSLGFCKVTESLGYNHDTGAYCKFVEHEGREILVKRHTGEKLWRPHSARERVQPLIDHFERLKQEASLKASSPNTDYPLPKAAQVRTIHNQHDES